MIRALSFSLPPETLEEFLDILRPTLGLAPSPWRISSPRPPVRSPTLLRIKRAATTATGRSDRSHPYRRKHKLDASSPSGSDDSLDGLEEHPAFVTHQRGRSADAIADMADEKSYDRAYDKASYSYFPLRYLGQEFRIILYLALVQCFFLCIGSPVSRTHTRNPLPRHPSYETLSSTLPLSLHQPPFPGIFTQDAPITET